ncbi:C-type mannose receptor 2 [Branchiostoma belcheri]|nr:C-type mannose receptor 2 [Branchiostoma belcheri]
MVTDVNKSGYWPVSPIHESPQISDSMNRLAVAVWIVTRRASSRAHKSLAPAEFVCTLYTLEHLWASERQQYYLPAQDVCSTVDVSFCSNNSYRYHPALVYCWRSEAQRCSRVYRVQTNSAGARDLCARDEARLVTIHTATARGFIESLICGDSWIGLTRNRSTGHLAWVDGVPFNSTALGGVTVRGDGGCTLLRKGRDYLGDTVTWESVSCSGETPTAHVICEKHISCSSDELIQDDCTCSTRTTTPARASTGPPAVAVSSTGATVPTEQNRRLSSSEAHPQLTIKFHQQQTCKPVHPSQLQGTLVQPKHKATRVQ